MEERKKVIMDELVAIKSSLDFRNKEGNVDDKKWRKWKKKHRFSSATWDFLQATPPAAFYSKRLANEGKTKRADDFLEKYPDVLPLFNKFILVKLRVKKLVGDMDI